MYASSREGLEEQFKMARNKGQGAVEKFAKQVEEEKVQQSSRIDNLESEQFNAIKDIPVMGDSETVEQLDIDSKGWDKVRTLELEHAKADAGRKELEDVEYRANQVLEEFESNSSADDDLGYATEGSVLHESRDK
ncbi:hypothetical protein HDE_04471 [Halotydeus destructor]|nr:hypothetical protein HDE_04471 [Halotydeus destructor]